MSSSTQPKIVPVQGRKYQLRKLPAVEGSFIYMRMMGAIYKASGEQVAANHRAPARAHDRHAEPEAPPEMTAEQRVRALCTSGFMHLGHEDFIAIQTACLKAVNRVETLNGVETPMPVMTDQGEWVPVQGEWEHIGTNAYLAQLLAMEVCVDSLGCFFSETAKAT